MKTFYSILSAVINPVSGESISLGLLLSDGNNSFFNYSKKRLAIIGSVIDNNTKTFIRNYLKSIDSIIKKIDVNEAQTHILSEEGKNILVNEPYIEYLSNYNRNVVSFSKPVSIDVAVEEGVFDKLFKRFIDEETNIRSTTQSDVQMIKNDYFPKVANYFTTEKEFSYEISKKILLPVSIDLFGKNDWYVIGQFFDLAKPTHLIKNDFFDFQQVISVYPQSKRFVVSIEPDKIKNPDRHYFWKALRNQKKNDYVDVSEIDSITQYAREHGVVPV